MVQCRLNFLGLEIMKTCSVEGCENPIHVMIRGLCRRHYLRLYRHGTPTGGQSTIRGKPSKWILDNLSYEGDACLIYPYGRDAFGYGRFCIDRKMEGVHVIMCTINHGMKPSLQHEVRHLCGNGNLGCCAKNHLVWGTRRENMEDAAEHGTTNRGERCNFSKLTENEVIEILSRLSTGDKASDIAVTFGVKYHTISDIRAGRRWGWLTCNKRKIA